MNGPYYPATFLFPCIGFVDVLVGMPVVENTLQNKLACSMFFFEGF